MSKRRGLPLYEWIVVLSAVLFLLVLGMTSLVSEKREAGTAERVAALPKQAPMANVKVEGAVVRPGVYQVPRDSSLGALLRTAGPADDADLSGIDRERLVGRKRKLVVPHKKEVRS